VDDLDLVLAYEVLSHSSCIESASILKKRRDSIERSGKHTTKDLELIREIDYLLLAADQCASKIEWAKDKLKHWNTEFSYDQYRLARSLIDRTICMFHLAQISYSQWLGIFDSHKSLHEICEIAKRPPRFVHDFIHKRMDGYLEYYNANIDNKLVAITVRCPEQLIWSLAIARIMKKEMKDVHVTIGGSLLSFYTSQYKKLARLFEYVDSVVLCDGETAISDLHEAVNGQRPFSECRNTVLMKEGEPYLKTPIHFEKLDTLPPPDFDELPIEDYFSPSTILPMAITRGCPFACAFCNYNANYSNRYRQESVESVVAKVKYLKKKYNTPYYYWAVSILPLNYIKQLSQKLMEEDAGIYWYCQVRVDSGNTEEVCRMMYKSGARLVESGIESGSDRVLQMIDKGYTRDDIESNIKYLKRAGIEVLWFVIGDLPTETKEEWGESLDLLIKYERKLTAVYCNRFKLCEGSPIWMKPEKYNVKFKNKDDDVYFIPQYIGETYLGVPNKEGKAKLDMIYEFINYTSNVFILQEDQLIFIKYGMPYMSHEQFIFKTSDQKEPVNPYEKYKDAEWEFIDEGNVLSGDFDDKCPTEDESDSKIVYLFNKINGETLELNKEETRIISLLRKTRTTIDGMIDYVCSACERDDSEFRSYLKVLVKKFIYMGFLIKKD
jgi:radical SAM superfamily enzyme YgiQ (UPF0313 family)